VRLAYFGLPLGACLLHGDGHDIAMAVLPPVEAPGRRRLARLAGTLIAGPDLEARVPVELARAAPDLLVSWYWTRRLPAAWLSAPRLGGIGVHPSLLPRHRGPNPFFWTIDSGDPECGVSVHRLTPEYDTGAVLAQIALPVGERNAWQLARALDRPSLRALRDIVRRVAAGEVVDERPQDEALATWAPEPEGEALRVDWTWPTARVLRRIRALSPVPGLALEICGLPLFVTRAADAASSPAYLEPGEARAVGDDVIIRTGDGAIVVTEAQCESEAEEAEILPLGELAQLVASRSRAV
jgi:methionyl-tRNA formyltransferase